MTPCTMRATPVVQTSPITPNCTTTLRKHTQSDEDDDSTYYPSQDYGDNSNVDPEYRPSKKELKGADKEGDK